MKIIIKLGDYLGVLASAMCLLHCALTPIALLIPFLAQIPHHDDFHLWMIAIVALPIIFSLLPSFTQHRKAIVLLFGLSGFTCFLISIFIVGPRYGELAEMIIASIAGVNLIIAHVKNRGYCRNSQAQSKNKLRCYLLKPLKEIWAKPRNGSWTGSSVYFSAHLARRDDDGTSMFIGGVTKSRGVGKCTIEPVALSPKWCKAKTTESFDHS